MNAVSIKSCFQCEHLYWHGGRQKHNCPREGLPIDRFYLPCDDYAREPGTENPENDIPEGVILEIGQQMTPEMRKGAKIEVME